MNLDMTMPSIARQGRFEISSTELLLSNPTDLENKNTTHRLCSIGFGGEDNYFLDTFNTALRFIFQIMHVDLFQLN